MSSEMIDLSVIIVSWNVCQLLRRCLHSINDSAVIISAPGTMVAAVHPSSSPILSCEVVVVDNASGDGSDAMVLAEFPAVRLITNSENRGFTAANNQGIAVANGRYVLLLNPDTELVSDALVRMVAHADAYPDVAVVGPCLLNPDGSIQHSRYRFPSLMTAFFESTWFQPYAPRRLMERYHALDLPTEGPSDVDWVRGAALLARREAIDAVGLLDEGFFMYSEELDWCRRFQDAGWRVVYLPEAKVVHHEGKSSEQVVAARHVHFQTSKVRYFRKHHGAMAAEGLRCFLLGNYVWQLGLEAAKWLVGHRRELRAERVAAYLQLLRSRLV